MLAQLMIESVGPIMAGNEILNGILNQGGRSVYDLSRLEEFLESVTLSPMLAQLIREIKF